MGNGRRLASVALLTAFLTTVSCPVTPAAAAASAPAMAAAASGSTAVTVAAAVGSAAVTVAAAVGSAPATPAATEPVPVILVHGLTAGGAKVWGDRKPTGRGLYARLMKSGYVPGKTLFCYDYTDAVGADYAALAGAGLERVVREALAAGGPGRVDMITFGSGALVARYWVAARSGCAPIRNLVMIAPPNHGQFQADLLKVLYHTDRLVKSRTVSPARIPPEKGFPDPPDFTSEDQYVGARARDYQALYADYVLSGRLLGEEGHGDGTAGTWEAGGADSASVEVPGGGAAPPPPPDFERWLASARPELLETWVYSAENQPAPPGLGLTLAYYEILSIRVGRQLYLAGVATAGRVPPLPPLEDLISADWRSQIEGYLKQLLLDWAPGKARELWARYRAGLGLGLGELLTGFEPTGPATSRLVPEYLSFPDPGGTPCVTEDGARPVLCNGFLHDWQRRETAARPADSRYVTIAGTCPSLLGLAGRRVGPNDFVVEAASAVMQPELPDEFRLGRGLSWVHGLLPTNGRLLAYVFDALGGAATGTEATAGAAATPGPGSGPGATEASHGGTGTASLWRPVYRPVDGETEAQRQAVLAVTVADPAVTGLEGLTAVAWLAASGAGPGDAPAVLQRIDLEPAGREEQGGPVLSGTLRLPATGDPDRRLLLGVRLVPDARFGPGFLTMGRHLGRETQVPFSYTVSETVSEFMDSEVSVDEPSVSAGSTEARETDDDTADGRDVTPLVQTGESGKKPGEGPDPGTGGPDGSGDARVMGRAEIVPTLQPPLVNVVRVTKLTTDKREDRTFHTKWEWDFGDGERLSDEDPTHTSVIVEHTFPAGGTYTVSARSVANDGRVLRDLTWTVEAGQGEGPDGRTFIFEAETIVEPKVNLTVEGPKKWVTGKPARFEVKADVSWPPRTRRQVIRAYPGWVFDVVWEKPGTFEVRAAVTVKQSYEFPDQRLTIFNTYVTTATVKVFTPGLTE